MCTYTAKDTTGVIITILRALQLDAEELGTEKHRMKSVRVQLYCIEKSLCGFRMKNEINMGGNHKRIR